MQLHNTGAEFFVPDGVDPATALARTTHLAVGAHPDDIPIMAYHGILECFGRDDRWFLGVTVTDGAGSPRSDRYADHTDGAMRLVRIVEERKAAAAGEYTAALLLDYTSLAAKDPDGRSIVEELAAILDATHPDVLYTHNLADKHDTHVAVALRTIEAVRAIGPDRRPRAMFGCEVWRDLDWLVDSDKVAFDVSERQNLAAALIGVYDSQISGGKRYDQATAGRRLAHATFSESHAVDDASAVIYAMDLTPLIQQPSLEPAQYVAAHLDRLRSEIMERIARLQRPGG